MNIRKTSHYFARRAAAVAIFLLAFGVAGLSASGNQEMKLKKGKINLGAIHVTFEPSYFYEGVEYDTFDRSYRREIDQIAREHNVNFINVEGGVDIDPSGYAVQELLDLGVAGIVIFQNEPGMAPEQMTKAQAAAVPILVHGMEPQNPMQVPYVGFDEYGSCEELGKAVAQKVFLRDFSTEGARVLVLSTGADQTDVSRADGFIAGFRSLVPGADFLKRVQDTGTVESADQIVAANLQQTPPVNVIFATTDFQAAGAMAALTRFGRSNVILSGVGGSREAMYDLLQPNSPWKGEVGLAIKDFADESYKIMMGMISGEFPKHQDKVYLVKSPVFVQPTREQVQQYLLQNHDEQLPDNSGK